MTARAYTQFYTTLTDAIAILSFIWMIAETQNTSHHHPGGYWDTTLSSFSVARLWH